MLLESVFETLRRIENERLQLPIFYESPIALRYETGDPSLDIFLDYDFTPVCLLFPLRNKVCIINFFY